MSQVQLLKNYDCRKPDAKFVALIPFAVVMHPRWFKRVDLVQWSEVPLATRKEWEVKQSPEALAALNFPDPQLRLPELARANVVDCINNKSLRLNRKKNGWVPAAAEFWNNFYFTWSQPDFLDKVEVYHPEASTELAEH